MKNFLLTIAFLSMNLVSAQTLYSYYLDSSSEWRRYGGGWDGINNHSYYTTTHFDGLSTIDGKIYYQEFSNILHITNWWSGITTTETIISDPKYVREDDTGKFYRINSITNVEEVFFDNQQIINAEIGQTFPYPGAACLVESIETNYLGSLTLKRIKGPVIGNNAGSLEGVGQIGSNCGLGVEGGGYLNCYTKQGIDLMFGNIPCNEFPIPERINLANYMYEAESNLSVFPNPTKDSFRLISKSKKGNSEYQIFNLIGLQVKTGSILQYEQEIDISDLPIGIYILKLENNAIQIMKK